MPLDGFRLDWRPDPFAITAPNPGRFRFDAPDGSVPVSYVCTDELACFAEVFGDRRLIDERDGECRILRVRSTRKLRVLALDDGAALLSLGLDGQIGATRPYTFSQQWSAALHLWYARLDGLRYVSRREPAARNVCLYLDRCRDALSVEDLGRIDGDIGRLEQVVDRYPIATTLLL